MKRLLLILLLVVGSSVYAAAHDVILKLNGESIKALVIEVGETSVKFKRMDNPNGPVYVCSLSEIQSITYENGKVEEYNAPSPVDQVYYVDDYNVRYRDIKDMYSPRDYVSRAGDYYSPAVAGVTSWLIPGLGQCIDGEWGRGLGIVAANCGFVALEFTEAALMYYYSAPVKYYSDAPGGYSIRSSSTAGTAICLGCAVVTALSHFAFNIWNICDAVNIAKVKNMYFQDRAGGAASLDIHLEPQLAMYPAPGASGFQPAAGLRLSVSF